VAASKPKALGMVNAGETIPKLRLRLPPSFYEGGTYFCAWDVCMKAGMPRKTKGCEFMPTARFIFVLDF